MWHPPKVVFNASVILAGLKSPTGGSGKVLNWAHKRFIIAIVSEVILDEVFRNIDKVGLSREQIKGISTIFKRIYPAPKLFTVKSYKEVMIDYGDAHVLALGKETKADFLVTLDKRHLLILQKKIKEIKIVSPKQLIEILSPREKQA